MHDIFYYTGMVVWLCAAAALVCVIGYVVLWRAVPATLGILFSVRRAVKLKIPRHEWYGKPWDIWFYMFWDAPSAWAEAIHRYRSIDKPRLDPGKGNPGPIVSAGETDCKED